MLMDMLANAVRRLMSIFSTPVQAPFAEINSDHVRLMSEAIRQYGEAPSDRFDGYARAALDILCTGRRCDDEQIARAMFLTANPGKDPETPITIAVGMKDGMTVQAPAWESFLDYAAAAHMAYPSVMVNAERMKYVAPEQDPA